jgi:DNA-binding NarL/FixJ family response regulator
MRKQNQNSAPETELKLIRRLLALSLIEGKTNREQIALLAAAGMDRHEIAELVGTTAGTVSVEISNLKKRKSKESRGKTWIRL